MCHGDFDFASYKTVHGRHVKTFVQAVCERKIEWSSFHLEEAIVSFMEHQSIHCRPQGKHERRCVGIDKKVVRQPDRSDPSGRNHQELLSKAFPILLLPSLLLSYPFYSLFSFLLLPLIFLLSFSHHHCSLPPLMHYHFSISQFFLLFSIVL